MLRASAPTLPTSKKLPSNKKLKPSAALPPLPLTKKVDLADGSSIQCCAADSWAVIGQSITIPESAWTMDTTDTSSMRYAISGLSMDSGSPLYIVEVARGAQSGARYLVAPTVVHALMTRAMRRRAGSKLSHPPLAV
jgi:hypothetical protein